MSKEESKYGFKDKAKAEESLELLKSEELQYQKLTVRGLLGRAKKVLSMTKAEEKIKNIKSAIEVFEKWLEENGGSAGNKNSKVDDSEKVETVPGLGFKDKTSAQNTLKILDGRDPDYQKLAIKGLIGSSKRVLSSTKSEEKTKSIKDGVKILEDFLEKFELENRSKSNLAYLPSSILEKLSKPDNALVKEFIEVYTAKKNYKMLRTIEPDIDSGETKTWDIVRNRELHKLKKSDMKLFDDKGNPTKEHLAMIQWAYSPQPEKVKAFYENEKAGSKRKSTSETENDSKKKRK